MNPRSIGVIGASPQPSRGNRALRNVIDVGFEGAVYPINPKYDEILDLPCYPSVADTPSPPDMIVLAIPARAVPAILEDALAAGTRAALVLASGFGEAGGEGLERHRALQNLAARGLLICGPNCYGVLNLHAKSGTWGGELPRPLVPGNLALLSQSGGSCALVTNPLMQHRGVGFSFIISCGNQAGVSIEDYLDYLVDDPNTEVISAFVEGFREPRRLPAIAARAAARRKPIVMLKVGRSEAARANAMAHTGSLAGDAEIMDAFLDQHGFVQVRALDDLLETSILLSVAREKRAGWRIGTLSGSGGECGRVSDAAQAAGFTFPPLSAVTRERVLGSLPDFGSPANPLDGTGALFDDPQVFPALTDALLDDGLEAYAFHINATPPGERARATHRPFAAYLGQTVTQRRESRLVVAFSSTTTGATDTEMVGALGAAGIPYLQSPEKALRAIAGLNHWSEFLARGIPSPAARAESAAEEAGEDQGEGTRRGRGVDLRELAPGPLPFMQAHALLSDFGVPIIASRLCGSEDAAVAAAEELGYPVVLKIESPGVLHKTDAGGVRLGCPSPEAVRDAYAAILQDVRAHVPRCRIDGVVVQPMTAFGVEVILGVKSDPLIGPAVLAGLGGIYTEVLRDVALRVPPITQRDAEDMLGQLRGSALLRGVRGAPAADVPALVQAILRLAELAEALEPRLTALDLNPVVVLPQGQGVIAVDALIELR